MRSRRGCRSCDHRPGRACARWSSPGWCASGWCGRPPRRGRTGRRRRGRRSHRRRSGSRSRRGRPGAARDGCASPRRRRPAAAGPRRGRLGRHGLGLLRHAGPTSSRFSSVICACTAWLIVASAAAAGPAATRATRPSGRHRRPDRGQRPSSPGSPTGGVRRRLRVRITFPAVTGVSRIVVTPCSSRSRLAAACVAAARLVPGRSSASCSRSSSSAWSRRLSR